MKYVTSECSTLLIIREMKMTMSYPLILVRMAIIKRQKISSVGEYMNKPLYAVSEEVNWHNHYGKHYRHYSKI